MYPAAAYRPSTVLSVRERLFAAAIRGALSRVLTLPALTPLAFHDHVIPGHGVSLTAVTTGVFRRGLTPRAVTSTLLAPSCASAPSLVRVFRGVLVTPRAVCFAPLVVRTVDPFVTLIVGRRVPTKIVEPIVKWVSVVVASHHPFRAGTNESFQYQTVHASAGEPVPTTVRHDLGNLGVRLARSCEFQSVLGGGDVIRVGKLHPGVVSSGAYQADRLDLSAARCAHPTHVGHLVFRVAGNCAPGFYHRHCSIPPKYREVVTGSPIRLPVSADCKCP
jgi:hypothetical protein